VAECSTNKHHWWIKGYPFILQQERIRDNTWGVDSDLLKGRFITIGLLR
jgi:hypothetical protein